MKVRCIDDLGTSILEVGGIYKGELKFNHWYNEKRWYLEGEKFRKFCFREKAFEIIEEDNKMQEKTFREVIADIKEGEVWVCEKINRKIIKGDDGNIEIRKLNNETFGRGASGIIFSDEKYKLQRKEFTFDEAFKAYEEGKEIESCVNGTKFKKKETTEGDIQDFYVEKHEKVWWRFIGFDLELMRGKWYINN